MLDPRRVLILRAVASAGSISAGARALGWTQPAITQHLNALERAAGTPLLLRHAGGVTPTEAGRVLLGHADAIHAHLDAATAELDELRQLRRGTVRLAAFPSALATLVPAALARLEPGLDVQLTEAEPPEALTLLRDGSTDVALVFSYAEDPAPVDDHAFGHLAIVDDPVELVLPAGHPAAGAADLRLSDLAGADWVAGCPRCREHLVHNTRVAGFEPRIRHETDDYVVVQSLVGQGLAVAVLPRTALAAYRNPAVVTRALPELTGRRILALYRTGADRIPSVRATLAALGAA
ncbi:MAG: LysR family transcriptional regulator [Propionicimonas sp.]|nr:LysR family transcriptional regulator [Propionicimonas sp.]